MPSVYLFATLDTKGAEADFVRQLLTSYGVDPDFADAAAHRLIDMLEASRRQS